MTIDEAISEEERYVKMNERDIKERFYSSPYIGQKHACMESINRSRQLIEWLNELKQLREQTRWIPVSERLPLLKGSYRISDDMLITNGYEVEMGYLVEREEKIFWHYYGSDIEVDIKDVDNDITAWMPLPEPYRQESEEQT